MKIDMKISVLMAAYNGERYIYKQLESLFNQTRMPDEVIICDDRSTDDTVTEIQRFISEHYEFPIILEKNKENMGYAKNFFKASEISTGEILFFCDQDDIWMPRKIEIMAKYLEENEKIGGLVCLYEVIDGDSNVVRKHKPQNDEIKVTKESFQGMIKGFNCGGLNFAVRRKYVDKYRTFIIENGLSHDVPLGIIISSYDELFRINQVFVQHRIHANNATKPEYGIIQRLGNIEKQIKSARNKLKWIEKCRPAVIDRISVMDKQNYDDAAKYYRNTITALEKRDLAALIKLSFTHNPMVDNRIAVFNALSIIAPKKRS